MKVLFLVLALLVLSVASWGGAVRAASFSSADAVFLTGVQRDALGQYAIGALAQNKAQDPRVKALAKTVTANATSANETLKKMANSHGIAPASKPTIKGFLPVLHPYGEVRLVFRSGFCRPDWNRCLDCRRYLCRLCGARQQSGAAELCERAGRDIEADRRASTTPALGDLRRRRSSSYFDQWGYLENELELPPGGAPRKLFESLTCAGVIA